MMQSWNVVWIRRAMLAALTGLAGCGQTAWNYDDWWAQERHPMVKPVRTVRPLPAAESSPAVLAATKDPALRPIPSASVDSYATAHSTPEKVDSGATTAPHQPVVQPAAPGARPFYRLYLTVTDTPTDQDRGDGQVELRQAPARSCGRLLEIAYPPSAPAAGSERACYLLYEEPSGFAAAVDLAAMVDVAPIAEPRTDLQGLPRFAQAVGLFYKRLDVTVPADAQLIDACIRDLDAVTADAGLDPQRRWLAALLSGWLWREDRFDDPQALRRFREAAEIAQSGSLERLAARGQEAQTLSGNGSEEGSAAAQRVLQAIEEEYGSRIPNNRMIRQAAKKED